MMISTLSIAIILFSRCLHCSYAVDSKCSALSYFNAPYAETAGEDLDATLESCCQSCNLWTRVTPCAGYVYDPTTRTCSIKWKLGELTYNSSSSVIIGYPGKQNYELVGNHEYPDPWISIAFHNDVGAKECAFYCLSNPRCRSFIVQSIGCSLADYSTKDLPNSSTMVEGPNKYYYQIQHNLILEDSVNLSTIHIGITIIGKAYNGVSGYGWIADVYSSITPKSIEACALRCAQTTGCLSLCFVASYGFCELYSITFATNPEKFQDYPEGIYMADIS